MSFIRKNINGILGTILFHLIVVIICLACKINTIEKEAEGYIIIDPQDFEPKEEILSEDESMMTDEEIAQYMQNLGHTGSNYSGTYNLQQSGSQSEAMSQEEMQKMYEEAILREKYGDKYDEAMDKTSEDYIDPTRMETYQSQYGEQRNVVRKGNALVYAEPDNSARESTFLKVPVFTCQGSGVVVVRVAIASSGKVNSVEVISSELTSDAECLTNAARNAALNSRFSKISGNKSEGGKITYTFVKQ